jgi:isopenicillin-N epimerase
MRRDWMLDPRITFLNHGSFGSCPKAVLRAQDEWRTQMESAPIDFLVRRLPGLLQGVREQIAPFVGANPSDIAFVHNATEGVNCVLRALSLQPGDELLTTNHTYGACANALRFVAERWGATVKVVDIPFPIHSAADVVELISRGVTQRTRLALIDHVTSITGLVFPITNIVRVLREHGVETLVDGAHAPGMVDLDIESIGAAYYTGNFHKWLCAPKGAAMLWVRRDLQTRIYPLAISHGFAAPIEQRFQRTFDWTGTSDPTPWLCIPDALRVMADMAPGGWPTVRRLNHELALRARDLLCKALNIPAPAPDTMLGSLAAVPLPPTKITKRSATIPPPPISQSALAPESSRTPDSARLVDSAPQSTPSMTMTGTAEELYLALLGQGFETLVAPFPAVPGRVLRVSAQLYNTPQEYERLAAVLPTLL